ncbi:cytochrome b (mitochondrion) [Theileria orientalis]|uniref:Cytochrome b n=1 Tax=Theileria orientalis TaxID=68886 RepID=A0A976SJY8_THEOR|nr:cytochrome b [Theileria orientalis]
MGYNRQFNIFAINLVRSHLISYLVPKNLNVVWNLGFLVAMAFNFQVFSGVFVSFKFKAGENLAFKSIRDLFTEENFGWFVRFYHSNGVSIYFLLMFLHVMKGVFYSSKFLHSSWYTGIVILFVSIAIAFIGYVLPEGQMSFWGSTVIMNLMKWTGDLCVVIFGGESIGEATYKRFYIYHYVAPLIVYLLICFHIYYLHRDSSTNPLSGVDTKSNLKFYVKELWNDAKNFLIVLAFIAVQVGFGSIKIFQADPDNSVIADPSVTPHHIVPEWYLLLFYATLKVLPTKVSGLLAIVAVISLIVILVESRAFSSIISTVHYHRNWTVISNTLMSLIFVLGYIGQMVINTGLAIFGTTSLVLLLILSTKLLDSSRMRF